MPVRTLPPIASIAAAPAGAVEALLDQVFGPDRRQRTAYRIRDRATQLAHLSFAILDHDGGLLASSQCWPVALDGAVPLVLVGPVAVSPAHQGEGLGRALMERTVGQADATGAPPLVLIGDPEYYGRFGFTADATACWTVPGPVERRRLLARVPAGLILPAAGALGPRR